MRVYIVWVKGKKITLKILQVESFETISQEDLTRETLAKLVVWYDSSTSSHVLFSREPFSWANGEIALILHFMLDSSPT